MRIPFISKAQPSKFTRSLSKTDVIKNGKASAKETQMLFDFMRESNEAPQPYHVMPELTFIGLWKWF